MKNDVEQRAIKLGLYICEQNATIRKAAEKFGISKSTVHKDVSQRLTSINTNLYQSVKNILDTNKAQRHIRGGLATKRKYSKEPRKKENIP